MMQLTQSRVVPLAIFTAITAAVMAILLFQGQLVFGHQDPDGCNISLSSVGIRTVDANGTDVIEVSHGMVVNFQSILSVAEVPEGDTACNFAGGTLTITTPDGEAHGVAGGDTATVIPLVSSGNVYSAPAVRYIVDQADAVNGELVVSASYEGGVSHSGPKESTASGASEKKIDLMAPSITVAVTPAEQTIFEGGDADFRITVTNTGGFQLSNVQVSDSLDTTCVAALDTLEVGGVHSFECEMSPAQEADNVVTATAAVTGGVPAGQESVTATATASISVEPVAIEVEITPSSQKVRIGEPANFEVTVTNPNTTDIVEVAVAVPNAEGCDQTIGSMGPRGNEAGTDTYSYTCSSTLELGTTMVTATATGTVSEVGTTVTDMADAEVVVFEAVLGIEITPREHTIRADETVNFTITVSNHGDAEITGVGISAPDSAACSVTLGTLAAGQSTIHFCTSGKLTENTEITMTVSGIAPDGGPVTDDDTINVDVIYPNSVVDVSEVESMSFRVVVHVLNITETNTGDSPLSNVYVDVVASGTHVSTLRKDSKEFIGDDAGDDGVLSPGETWEWRLVTVSLQGPGVVLAGDATAADFTATGHGTDPLGGDITHPAYASELDTLQVPIS